MQKYFSQASLSALYNTAILLFACFSQLKMASLLAALSLFFFQSLYKKQSETVTFKLFNIYLQECPMLHFLQGTMVSLGVGSVENWAEPLYQGQSTVAFDVSKGCYKKFKDRGVRPHTSVTQGML